MRGLLLATDFVRKIDGTLTPLEINTNSGHEIKMNFERTGDNPVPDFMENFSLFFNHVDFDAFLKSNNIIKIITIDKPGGTARIFESFCVYYNYQYEKINVPEGTLTIPVVEDGEDRLIVRISYDAYALIDDLYARDMFEFHNLIKNESFASPVTFKTGDTTNIDTIIELEASIDGAAPNYIIKPRVPGYSQNEYPQVYRLENETDLNQLKSQINQNQFIQKYEFNPSVGMIDNRITFIRSMDLIYGPNLDIINVITYKSINAVSTQNSLFRYDSDFSEGKRLNKILTSKWHPKFNTSLKLSYHFDANDEILLPDFTDKLAKDLVIEEEVLGIRFTDPIKNFQPAPISDLSSFTNSPSRILQIVENPLPCLFINISAQGSNGKIYSWYDGIENFYMLQKAGSDQVQYSSQRSASIEPGDNIFIFDVENQNVKPLTVTDVYYDIKDISTYEMSLNKDYKEFFIKLDDGEYLLQHNANDCNPNCGVTLNCSSQTTWGDYYCSLCSKNSPGCPNCGGSTQYFCNSDLRMKENLIMIGKSLMGISIYQFNYIGSPDRYEGVVAQDLIGTPFEKALQIAEDGFYKVDYSKIDVEFKIID